MKSMWRDDLPTKLNPISFFLFVSRPHARMALLASLCVVLAAITSGLAPYLYKLITDNAFKLNDGIYMPLVWSVLFYFALALVGHLLWRCSGFAGMRWATGVRATARSALFAHLSKHSYQYFSDRFAGSLLSRIKQAGDGARDMVEGLLWQLLSFVVSVITGFIIVFLTSPLIGFILLSLFVIIIPYNYYYSKKRVPLSMAAQDAETALNGATVDSLTNILSVHEFAKRNFEDIRLKTFLLKRRELGMKNWQYGEWTLLWNGVLINFFMAGVVFASVYLAVQGVLTPGDVILMLAMVWLLEERFIFLGSQFNHFTEVWGQLSESLTDIVRPHTVADRVGAHRLALTESSITFDHVSFKYEGTEVFSNLAFTIPAGQRVGLVGRSGAGKTTLVKLLLRHYDLSGGTILLGGEDIAQVTKESLREKIAVVPQEPSLFHRTIHENIAYSKPEATREEVIAAATQAQAHEFIERLPEGYESLVGERGIKLSGGQRQRIVIARALLKNAPILLLDEATSALDSESEVLVQKALLTLMEGRTVIAVAHRLSTLRAMDRLIIFSHGKIIEDGTHDELITKKGVYADLWNHQAGGFLEEA
ncbi:MAG: ABC transporter ATP-binding protein [Patescibacteria group bacterium]